MILEEGKTFWLKVRGCCKSWSTKSPQNYNTWSIPYQQILDAIFEDLNSDRLAGNCSQLSGRAVPRHMSLANNCADWPEAGCLFLQFCCFYWRCQDPRRYTQYVPRKPSVSAIQGCVMGQCCKVYPIIQLLAFCHSGHELHKLQHKGWGTSSSNYISAAWMLWFGPENPPLTSNGIQSPNIGLNLTVVLWKKHPYPYRGGGRGGEQNQPVEFHFFLLGNLGIVIQPLEWNCKVTFLNKPWALVRKYLRLALEELSASMITAAQFFGGMPSLHMCCFSLTCV